MTEQEIKERAEIYRSLVEFKPFQYLVDEINERAEQLKEAIVSDLDNDRIVDKAIRMGMKQVLDAPLTAIREADNIKEDSEPS
jgi:hypothetical protein